MERRLAAILAADVVGFSRLMGANEARTLRELKTIRAGLIDKKIGEHGGRIFKTTGDGVLAEFSSVVNAVACAADIQDGMRERDTKIALRIGVHLGDVMIDSDDVYGDGVNIAVRLQSIAERGGICVSHSVREHVGNRLETSFEDMGERELKNIAQPVHAYRVAVKAPSAPNENGDVDLAKRRPSIAVLPFTNMSGDPEQEYFSDGITEDIVTDLSKVSGLSVIARHSAFSYKNKALKIQQIGQELGAHFVVEGSVRKSGGRIRVTSQLVSCADGTHLWAERFDRDLTDIFAIQDEITHAIVDQLKIKLLPAEKKSICRNPTDNIDAYTYYLRGRGLLYRGSVSGYRAAREMFVKATELDPVYARAYAGIADCDCFLYLRSTEPISPDSILALSEKALALDSDLAEAHASRGGALVAAKRYVEAQREFEKAIELDPNSFEGHYFFARACVFQGKIEEAIDLFSRAAAVKPDDYSSVCILPQFYNSLGRKEEARETARKGVKLAERHLTLHPDDGKAAELGAGNLIELGESDRAREWLARALALAPDNPVTLYNVACSFSMLGDVDRAFELLARGVQVSGPEWGRWIEHDSMLDPLRSDQRYKELLETIRQRAKEKSG